jgi:hypothetical protein
MFSDELIPYPLKRFQKTFSKHQVIYATKDAVSAEMEEPKGAMSAATGVSRTPAKPHASKALADDLASHKDDYGQTAKKAEGNAPALVSAYGQSIGQKGSRLTKVLSGIDRQPALAHKDSVGRKASHLGGTPQMQYMGRRGQRN